MFTKVKSNLIALNTCDLMPAVGACLNIFFGCLLLEWNIKYFVFNNANTAIYTHIDNSLVLSNMEHHIPDSSFKLIPQNMYKA